MPPGLYFVIIFFLLFIEAAIINIIWWKIISKAKSTCNKGDFYKSWTRYKVKQNIDQYFDEENGKKYLKIMKIVRIIFPINVLLLLSIPLYQYYFSN